MASIFKKTASGVTHIFVPLIIVAVITVSVLLYLFILHNRSINTFAAPPTPINLNYTALGDSITMGYYTGSGGGYVNKYTNYINADLNASTTTTNLGVGGWTSTDLLNAVRTDQTFRTSISNANIITIFIGMNDFYFAKSSYFSSSCGGSDNQDCLRTMVVTFKGNMSSIISEIKSLNPDPNLVMRLSEIYYPTTGNPTAQPYYTVLNSHMRQLNDQVHTLGTQNNYSVAALYAAYNGQNGDEDPFAKGYLTADGIHPNDLGNTVIAIEFRKLGYTPLDSNLPPSLKIIDPDVTNDGFVRTIDTTKVVQAYGIDCGNPAFNPEYDLDGNCAVRIPDITQVNDSYGLNWPPNNLPANRKLYFYIKGVDPEGHSVSYSMGGLPSNATLDATKGKFSWTPSATQVGTYTVSFKASDGSIDANPISFPITVIPAP